MAGEKKVTKPRRAPARGAVARVSRGRVRPEGASFPLAPSLSEMPADYAKVLARLKQRIATAQSRAALAVSRELSALYWYVGQTIVQRQANAGWGDAIVERLAHDLRQAFPDTEGFSPRNVWRMRSFYLAWSGAAKQLTQPVSETAVPRATKKLPQAVSELPWGHNIVLLQQLEQLPRPPLVRRTDASERLEPGGASGADRKEGSRAAGKGRHQLPPRAAVAAVRAGSSDAQRPVHL